MDPSLELFENNSSYLRTTLDSNPTTVSAQIRGRRLIKKLGFYGDGLLQFFPKMPQKASKRGLLAQKSGGLLEFQSSGGLIKSGLLFAQIQGGI